MKRKDLKLFSKFFQQRENNEKKYSYSFKQQLESRNWIVKQLVIKKIGFYLNPKPSMVIPSILLRKKEDVY